MTDFDHTRPLRRRGPTAAAPRRGIAYCLSLILLASLIFNRLVVRLPQFSPLPEDPFAPQVIARGLRQQQQQRSVISDGTDSAARRPPNATTACPQALRHQPFDLVCVGDSITFGDGSHLPPSPARRRPSSYPGNYPRMLEAELRRRCQQKDIRVQNFGKGSRTLLPDNTFSYRRTREHREALHAIHTTATDLLLFLGTNDVKPKHWRGRRAYEEAHESLLQTLCAPPAAAAAHNGDMPSPLRNVWLVIPPPAFPNPRTRGKKPKQQPLHPVAPERNDRSNEVEDAAEEQLEGGAVLDVSRYLGGINGSRLESDVAPALRHIWHRAQQQQQHRDETEGQASALSWRLPPSRCADAKVHLVDLRQTFSFLTEIETRLVDSLRREGASPTNLMGSADADYAMVKRYFFDGIHPTMDSQNLITQTLLESILAQYHSA